jgi:hypothetical protein
VDEVLPWVPVRQWVLTQRYRVRYQMAWNHGLSRAVLRVYYVDPRSKLVMVNTAVRKPGLDLFSLQEMGALWTALVRQLGGDRP